MNRREYDIEPIHVNRIKVNKVIIDPHYEENHSTYMNDDLILRLVRELDDRFKRLPR